MNAILDTFHRYADAFDYRFGYGATEYVLIAAFVGFGILPLLLAV